MSSDTQRLGDTIGWGLIDLAWGVGYIIMAAIHMFALSPRLALVVLSVMPVIAVVTKIRH